MIEVRPRVTEIPAFDRQVSINNPTIPQKKKVCAYCRVSTDDKDQVTSYELQKSHYESFIKSKSDWDYAGIFADYGKSATRTQGRTEFQRMIEESKVGKIDLILTKSISRFARNTIDCLSIVRALKAQDPPVGVFFEKENLDTLDPKNELLLTILASLAQEESRSTSENLKWSIRKRFQAGKARCPTRFLLGYDKDEQGKMVINEAEAMTVRRIYKDYLNGKSANFIAKELKAEGVPSSKGNSWGKTSILNILKNERFKGDVLMQKTYTVDFISHKQKENKGQKDRYYIEDHHPAIISREEWNAVQEEIKRRYEITTKEPGFRQGYSSLSVMSNRLFCGHCGQPLIRYTTDLTRNGIKRKATIFRCRASNKKSREKAGCAPCFAERWKEKKLEYAFMLMLGQLNEDRSHYSSHDNCTSIIQILNQNGLNMAFKAEYFRELIEKALIFDDGKITWVFKNGFEYSNITNLKKRYREKMITSDEIE